MSKKWQTSHVIKIEQQDSRTRRYWIQIDDTDNFEFEAGQFITLDLPIHDRRSKRMRSYSIASEPDGTNVLELTIVRVEDGLGTTYIFEDNDLKSELLLKGPAGKFTLPELNPASEVVMVCTGTGVAPFRSMIRSLIREDKFHNKIHLIFGTRFEEGLLYRDEFEAIAKEYPNFSYSATLSREENFTPTEHLELKKGYLHQIYQNHYSATHPDRIFMLCGWRQMVDQAREHLKEMGYDDKQILLELYG